jgi:hypothetical protein
MKNFLIAICLVLFSSTGFSQSLIFCEKVAENGAPEKPSHIFTVSSKGGFFDFLVLLPEAVGTAEVKYDIYSVDDAGKETFDVTVSQAVQKEWVWFSKEVTFYKPGDYTIYVYTAEDRLLCTSMVKVVME